MSDEDLIRAAYAGEVELAEAREVVMDTIAGLDRGEIRVAEKAAGEWRVNEWVKEAILVYFQLTGMEEMDGGAVMWHDKIPTKRNLAQAQVRVVPPGVVRYGAYCEPGVIVMPGYVNIGAYVGSGTMVDTWATVGSCAQIGRGVHLSGGVGIWGVLEPPVARPVIIEDGAFIGSRCIVVEGVVVQEGAVLGANTTITASTRIIDVRGETPTEYRGVVPANSVVIPGMRPRDFPAGEYGIPCALIIGERTASTDRKTSLNEALRTFGVQV